MPDMAALITSYRDRTGHSYREIARRSGGLLSHQQVGKVATNQVLEFPEPRSIRAWAEALGESETRVLLGFARTLGLDVAPRSVQLPAGVDNLPVEAVQALVALAREMVQLRRAHPGAVEDHHAITAPVDDLAKARGRRPLSDPSGEVTGQADRPAARRPRGVKRKDQVEHLED